MNEFLRIITEIYQNLSGWIWQRNFLRKTPSKSWALSGERGLWVALSLIGALLRGGEDSCSRPTQVSWWRAATCICVVCPSLAVALQWWCKMRMWVENYPCGWSRSAARGFVLMSCICMKGICRGSPGISSSVLGGGCCMLMVRC